MRIIALEYHDVIDGADFDGSGFPGEAAASYKVTTARFAAQLTAIAATGVHALGHARDAIDGRFAGDPRPAVLFTFDDGGVSAYRSAAPLLEAHGWRGHFFVTTDRIGTPGFLDAAQIADLHARGHVIGTHSASHPLRMARCSEADLHREWRRSLETLAGILGVAPQTASVPGGYYAAAVARAAAAEGIRLLFTSEPLTAPWRVGDCHVFGRFTLRRGTSAAAAARLVGRVPSARARQWVVWNMKRVGKAAAGDAYLRVRALALPDA